MFYENWGESSGQIGGGIVTFMSIGSIVLSIVILVLHCLFNQKINTNIVWLTIIATGVLSLFLDE